MFESTLMSALTNRAAAVTIRTLASAAIAALLTLSAIPATFAASNQAYLRVPSRALGSALPISIEVNKSILVDLPTNAGEVIASAPQVATVVMRSKSRAIIQGVAAGTTNIFFLDPAGNNIAVLDLKVIQAASQMGLALERTLARVIPGSNIRVETLSDEAENGKTHFVLTGTVMTAEDKAVAEQMASELSDDGDDEQGSLIRVLGPQQVQLQVVVAEVQREAVKQFGINLNGNISIGAVNLGVSTALPNGGVSGVSNASGYTASASGSGWSLSATLRALERRGALRTLARPTLTAMSGAPAEFKAGGEFPYERVIDGAVSTEFKEYGVFLNFTPVIRSGGLINLLVDTSVKEPTGGGAITNRSAKSTVELPVGQTLAIAGMLQDSVRQQINQLPGLGNIPILGALFRSRDFIHSQTELVILVTPYIAESGYDVDKPTDRMQVAGDAEAVFLGRLEKIYGVGDDGMRGSYNGSVGFVLD
jgi:pilus assembly protein CpaC